jgi:hypothetical protein
VRLRFSTYWLHFQPDLNRRLRLKMNSSIPSPNIPPTKHTHACVRCSDRKVRCDKQTPCNSCVRHNVPCIFHPRRPPRRKRGSGRDELVDERLKRYEALLREKGIDANEVPGISGAENRGMSTNGCPDPLNTVWKQPQATVFKPQLLVGQKGTELVDK